MNNINLCLDNFHILTVNNINLSFDYELSWSLGFRRLEKNYFQFNCSEDTISYLPFWVRGNTGEWFGKESVLRYPTFCFHVDEFFHTNSCIQFGWGSPLQGCRPPDIPYRDTGSHISVSYMHSAVGVAAMPHPVEM